MEIIIPIAVLAVIAIVAAILLTLASSFFSVKENEKFAPIRECLPGANCGACGYSGCDAYAKALAEGQSTATALCVPGGAESAAAIADILGIKAGAVAERVAYVYCNGNCDVVERKYNYQGHLSCRTADMTYSGDKACAFACLGYGDCAAVCPKGAISVINGVAKVDPALCIGCGICVRTCPNNIIHLLNASSRTAVTCSNKDKGALTRKYCSNGCIGCGKCARTCPEGAIAVMENLAVINYNKCISCGKCAEVCPTHCIHDVNFICGSDSGEK
jgi:Na+-translocating ferredoxin:NAD+ oxidoreductase RNF subunit RnfB